MYTGGVRGKKEYGGVVELYYNFKKDKNRMKKMSRSLFMRTSTLKPHHLSWPHLFMLSSRRLRLQYMHFRGTQTFTKQQRDTLFNSEF